MSEQTALTEAYIREQIRVCGKPKFFNFDGFLALVDELVYSDEVINALKMLDMCPSFYREHYKSVLQDKKNDIRRRIATPLDYSSSYLEQYDVAMVHEKQMSELRCEYLKQRSGFSDLGDMIDDYFCYPRGPYMVDLIRKLNEAGTVPHIVEFGPAAFWLPYGLMKKGLKFKYKPLTLNLLSFDTHKETLKDVIDFKVSKENCNIFVCFEVIEHMWNDMDITLDYLKHGFEFDIVCLSTPLDTFSGGKNDKDAELQHLRTYSTNEFSEFAKKAFPGRVWNHYMAPSQVLVGELAIQNKVNS